MIKKVIYTLFLSSLFWSCNHFVVTEKEDQKDILIQEWNKIDKTSIEEPPLFESCETADALKQEDCFAKTLIRHIHSSLKKEYTKLPKISSDTIWVTILINKNAEVDCNLLKNENELKSEHTRIEKIVQKSILALPPLQPATKRGVPTNVRYKLPIVIKSL